MLTFGEHRAPGRLSTQSMSALPPMRDHLDGVREDKPLQRMLTGTHTGASTEMSLAAGLGANILVGGSNQTVALPPLSRQGQIGLDVTAWRRVLGPAFILLDTVLAVCPKRSSLWELLDCFYFASSVGA